MTITKGGDHMPRRDGTGPMGMGAMAGRGLGNYTGENVVKYAAGLGLGCRRGFSRNFLEDTTMFKTQKELLIEQKELLDRRLDVISKRLESL
jgi:hypothetical protein